MQRPTSLADLLKLTVGLDETLPVVATRSFAAWGEAVTNAAPAGGLWLVDTRDRPNGETLRSAPYEAALVLTGRGQPGSRLRRLLRRIRRRVRPRWSEHRTVGLLDTRDWHIHRLAFEDRTDVPIGFHLDGRDSTGAALLITRQAPFRGPVWAHVAQQLGVRNVDVISFQLRARGAAVVIVQAGERRCVVRLVPPGPLQPIVLKNHSAVLDLRSELASSPELLQLMPEPLFAGEAAGVAVLGETCLRGALAWQVVNAPLAPVIHRNAVTYLRTLMDATARTVPGSSAAEMLISDAQRIQQSTFASDVVRRILTAELERGRDILATQDITAYRSHGDYGYGNILVDERTGAVEGVIDWDTTRRVDLPGIDRVNLEIQIRRTVDRESFLAAVEAVWSKGLARDAIGGGSHDRTRALFALALCRYITRAMQYPELYRRAEKDFMRALEWLARTPA